MTNKTNQLNALNAIIRPSLAPSFEQKQTSRRNFVKGATALGGILFSKVASSAYDPATATQPYEGKAAINDPLAIPESRKHLGFAVRTYPYGVPSKYEEHVQRRSLEWLTPDPYASVTYTPLHQVVGMITPAGLHFERFHGGVPDINPADHRLVIHGLVKRPLIFTVDEIKQFPSVNRIHFIECPANGALEWKGVQVNSVQWTHGLTSCSEWTGVKLSTLLKEAGVDPKAKWVIPEGADASGLSRSLPMEMAMDDCLVVYGQNGEMLRREQGYPLRLLVPGGEGVMSIKYLRRLKVTNEPLQHREETSKYTELMSDGKAQRFSWVMEVNSVITYPSPDFTMRGPGKYIAKGIAWSGRGKIKYVDITLNGGKTWHQAKFTSPVLDKAWTRFEYEFDWDGEEIMLMSRATDETGQTQPTAPMTRKVRGTNNVYHRNAMVTWRVHAWNSENKGLVQNIQF